MAIEDLTALKASYSGNRYFNATILNTLVDEIVALNNKIATLEEQMANRMLCKNYKVEE